MTFSIIGHCQTTGMFGVAITTSSICVGARCPHARAGVGAVATQNITDPSLGPALLDQLATGKTATQALEAVINDLPNRQYRQLTVVDNNGGTACHTGEEILGIHAESSQQHCFAAGNLLSNESVPATMTSMFIENQDKHLAQRLLNSLQAGLNAGGEMGEVHSAALLVAGIESNSYSILATLSLIGSATFGVLYYISKRKI